MSTFTKILKSPVTKMVAVLGATLVCSVALADNPTTDSGISVLATNIMSSFSKIGAVLFATCYLLGAGFLISGLFKLHQHKMNPAQVQVTQSLTVILIGLCLLVIPSTAQYFAATLFGGSLTDAQTKYMTGYSGKHQIDYDGGNK